MATITKRENYVGLGDRLMSTLRVTGQLSHDYSKLILQTSYKYIGNTAFIFFTSSFFILVPLFIEISKEVVLFDREKALANDYKGRGYPDRQLLDMGFSQEAVFPPSLSLIKKK